MLTLTDAYVFGSNITAADFVSFSYKSSDQNFTITGPNVSYLSGGLNADGSLSSNIIALIINAGPLGFIAGSGTTGFGANNSDAGISFAFTPLLPPNFISPEVPHDVPTGPSASIQDLAIFAWREFIALNWVAMDPATTGVRGRPNVNLGVNAGFLSIKPDQNGSFPLLGWHTYRHKNELFPYYHTAQTDSMFDSSMPRIPPFSNYPNSPPPPNIPVKRDHPIPSPIPTVNDAVHEAFTKIDPNTVWQYYKLIGVQATPVNGPPSQTAPPDDVSYYYLANIVVETNQTLQNFEGSLPLITAKPFLNVYLNGATGSPFQMGGCQGCHGAAGQSNGGDMSVLIGFGPSNAAGPPESIDNSAEAAVKSYAVRSYGLVRARSLGLIPQ